MNVIPLTDLRAQYLSIQAEIDGAIREVLDSCAFAGGINNALVARFEGEFATFLGAAHCVTCANGTDALELALAGLGVSRGDEVLVPALSWISTAEAVTNVGATPVFIDSECGTCAIDPSALDAHVTPRTRAIIVVHLHGRPADLDPIMSVARMRGLKVLEDCAQSHGATYRGRTTGTIGDAAAFSFFPSKNLGALGDGGAVVTNDGALAAHVRLLGNHGQRKKNEHLIVGRNSRLDGLQASVLSAKLRHLRAWNAARREAAHKLRDLLPDLGGLVLPAFEDDREHVFHLFAIETDRRDELAAFLRAAGIATAVHYPVPMPFSVAYAAPDLDATRFPNAIRHCDRLLSLPLFPEMTDAMLAHIGDRVRTFFRQA